MGRMLRLCCLLIAIAPLFAASQPLQDLETGLKLLRNEGFEAFHREIHSGSSFLYNKQFINLLKAKRSLHGDIIGSRVFGEETVDNYSLAIYGAVYFQNAALYGYYIFYRNDQQQWVVSAWQWQENPVGILPRALWDSQQ